jgi:ParB/RepB/Spo0J family partition protein
MAGVLLTATQPRDAGGADTAGVAGAAPAAAPARKHPVGSGVAFERVEHIYRMDPRKIVLEGPYVRQFVEDAAYAQLRAAVDAEQDIGQHLGVRLAGPPTDRRRVLVYGMRRWRAAVDAGLERVPVRDYGPITEERALELQLLENEIRADPHPVDTALGFFLLTQQPDWNQARIARVFDKNKGYVSEMVRAGEAVARLGAPDRQRLYTAPRVTVRAFQALAQIREVDERAAALGALAADPLPEGAASDATGAGSRETAGHGTASAGPTGSDPAARRTEPAERRRAVDEAVFHARPLRNGRSFRVRWTDDDLRRDGERLAEEFRARFLAEYEHLLHRTAVVAGGGAAGASTPRIAELVASAAQEAARVDARIAGRGGAGD